MIYQHVFDDSCVWYKNGHLYQDYDLPANTLANGCKQLYQYGELHRNGDLPAIIKNRGEHQYWQFGNRYWL
jgi:hypothetical protein